MIRSSEELLAEAKKDEQSRPDPEPFQLWVGKAPDQVLVTFRSPDDASADQVADGQQSTRQFFDTMIADPEERRAFWREWGPLKSKYLINLLNAITDHFAREREKLNSGPSSTSTATRSSGTS